MRLALRAAVPLCLLGAALVGCGGDETPVVANGGNGKAGAAGNAGGAGTAGTAGQIGKAGAAGTTSAGFGGAAGSGQSGAAGQNPSGAAGASGSSGSAGSNAGSAGSLAGGAGGAAAGSGGSAAGNGGTSAAGSSGAAGAGGAAPTCAPGCKGVCLAGECCALERLCAGVCCGTGQVCSFDQCVVPGNDCVDGDDCAAGSYCDPRYGQTTELCPGIKNTTGRCLPKPPICASGDPPAPGQPITCVGKCEVKPAADDFKPTVKYAWGGKTDAPYDTDIMMTPVVIQLDDDNCDGKIDERDRPEIAVTVYKNQVYFGDADLVVLSVEAGKLVERWRAPHVYMDGQLAAGNIDGNVGNEIVGCGTDGTLTAFEGASGKVLWRSPSTVCAVPAIADLDGDGAPEVVVEGGIYDGKTGALKHAFSAPMIGNFAISDLDGDGLLDIVGSSQAFHGDGVLFASTGAAGYTYSNIRTVPSLPAIADLDGDGKPEVIADYFNQHQLVIWRYDTATKAAVVVRGPFDLNGTLSPGLCPAGSNGNLHGGGPVTVGDFNGDGVPDVALAGGVGYAVLDGEKLLRKDAQGKLALTDGETFLWAKQTQDCSSACTGSSLFDFNGDGKAEVVYADENTLRIYEGATGNVLFTTCNTSGTLAENPVIADVDGDDQADILVVSNAFGAVYGDSYKCDQDGGKIMTSGLRVFSSATGNWVRTRRTWNQHAYHVTNVNDDGSIPQKELPNWTQKGLNNFRQNKQPGGEFSAPDAVISLLAPRCGDGAFALVATIRNVGEAVLPAGVPVGFYEGSAPGKLLGTVTTTQPLYPAQGTDIVFVVPGGGASISSGADKVYAVVDDGGAPHAWKECRADNNTSLATFASCGKN